MLYKDDSEDEKPKKRRGAAANIVDGKRKRTPVKREGAIIDNEDFDEDEEVSKRINLMLSNIRS